MASYVIWDWNGTLLDDVPICIAAMNPLLKEQGLSPLKNGDHYRSLFGFPVVDYYRRLGFDFDKTPFEVLGPQFIANFQTLVADCPLRPTSVATLEAVQAMGWKQVILSATKEDLLHQQVAPHGIEHFFQSVNGIGDIYASSKVERGLVWKQTVEAKKLVMVGDSYHDAEVAHALGARAILVRGGHQAIEPGEGYEVIDSLGELLEKLD